MGQRKVAFAVGEYFHIYNRGVDKRDIVLDHADSKRFLQSMALFNVKEPIGSIYEHGYAKLGSGTSKQPLVSFVAFCLNPNHYHFLMTPLVDDGVEQFMQRFGTGYTKYFNNRRERTGPLFDGAFKAEHISGDDYLRQVSAYINYNDVVHGIPKSKSALVRTSVSAYQDPGKNAHSADINLDHDIVSGQFKNALEYCKYAMEIVEDIRE